MTTSGPRSGKSSSCPNQTLPAQSQHWTERSIANESPIQFALGETFLEAGATLTDRPPPVLSDDYEIVRELGRGGMGVVYLAHQKSLGRNVAVKVLRPGEVTFGPLVKRFLEEARHLARLRHPNIVPIHEIGQAGDEPYFTMDYVEGEPLSTILGRGRLSPSRALAILKQAAEGVQHAHEHGTIHRDLKPGNILVDGSGHAFVTDFGLARDTTQASNLTRSGEVMGTPAYMAPEQAQGQSELIGEATDIHALGVILYEMLTSQPPYGHDVPALVMARLIMDEPNPPRKIDRRIPRDLETICLKALAKTPDRRYASVRAFLEDIRRFESGESVLARRPGMAYPTLKNPLLWPTPGGSFPSQLDQTVWVGVADGSYRLSVHESGFYSTSTYSNWRGGQKKPTAWTELDLDKLPEEVTIAGKTVELTIPARSLDVVTLLQPAADTPVDLRKDVFRWASIPGAQSYSIGFVWMEDIPGGRRGNPVYNANSESTSFCFGDVPPEDIEKLKPLSHGSKGTWTVNAYDANGRHIGACVEGRSFTVTRGVAEQ